MQTLMREHGGYDRPIPYGLYAAAGLMPPDGPPRTGKSQHLPVLLDIGVSSRFRRPVPPVPIQQLLSAIPDFAAALGQCGSYGSRL